jgi:hypothetical protein
MNKYLLIALTILLLVPSVVSAKSDENITKRRPDYSERVQVQQITQTIESPPILTSRSKWIFSLDKIKEFFSKLLKLNEAASDSKLDS